MSLSFYSAEIARFDNSYARLPDRFYQRVMPTAVCSPRILRLNEPLVQELGIDLTALSPENLEALFAGNCLASGSQPIAQAYAGHQFGHFVPQLGDGRAILLGEVIDRTGKRRDVQLKGSGRTPFSRNGDGRAALGPVIREYILSEAMFHLDIPTTRSLAIVATGEDVFRERALPGAVLTRVAASHIRVGTFQYFLARRDTEAIKLLADYVIERHYPEARKTQQPYEALLRAVADAQASLVAKWLQAGFIHGVMNTDNCSISGETLDYGPCAFMDEYDPDTVFSSIDHHGRYAYGNQSAIAEWNVTRFAECLLTLLDDNEERAIDKAKESLVVFRPVFERYWQEGMCRKLGFTKSGHEELSLLEDFLNHMKQNQADYTLSFRYLSQEVSESAVMTPLQRLFLNRVEFGGWCTRWHKRLLQEKKSMTEIAREMNRVNPAFIARNHRVEQALQAAVSQGDFSKADRLIEVLSKPYEEQPVNAAYSIPPKPEERVRETFCGT